MRSIRSEVRSWTGKRPDFVQALYDELRAGGVPAGQIHTEVVE